MIALTRIDDRLIHGQVATQWVADSRANNIYIVDDETADDEFAVMVCKGLAPLRTEVFVLKTMESFDVLKEVAENDSKRGLILVKTPEPCHPCGIHICPKQGAENMACMKKIPVDVVMRYVDELLEEYGDSVGAWPPHYGEYACRVIDLAEKGRGA